MKNVANKVGWLVSCFWFNGPLRQYFSLYRAVSQRGRKRREIIEESENGAGRVVRRCWVHFQCRGVLLLWILVGQGPIALAVGAHREGGCSDIFFSRLSFLFSFSHSLGRRPDID